MRGSLTECPVCNSIWAPGSEEWEWQQCDACGWPDNIEEDWGDDDDEDYEWDEEDVEQLKQKV